ncbi:MAG: hypothetical protein R2911_41815 [Caldilineaceae bacterium]
MMLGMITLARLSQAGCPDQIRYLDYANIPTNQFLGERRVVTVSLIVHQSKQPPTLCRRLSICLCSGDGWT